MKPDIITLDLEMPEMDGLELLKEIKREKLSVGTILLSCLSADCGELTMKGLELGAFDYVPKLKAATQEDDVIAIRESLHAIFKAYTRQKDMLLRNSIRKTSLPPQLPAPAQTVPPPFTKHSGKRCEAVAIGISTGGPKALIELMAALPADIGVPVFVVQHMPALYTASLANNLNSRCAFLVKEAENGEEVLPNIAYIAPGGKQMCVSPTVNSSVKIIRITDDPPENNCRPSVDYLFRSLATHYTGRTTGVIMTGMGSDGAVGARLMKQNGAMIIAQNQATCVVYGMPKAVVDAGIVDMVLPLDRIAEEIVKSLGVV